MAPRNLFAIGIDPRNRAMLDAVPGAGEEFVVHELLPYDAIKEGRRPGAYNVVRPLELARRRLDGFEGSIDGFLHFWDFPVGALTAVLAAEYGCPGPDLASVLKCEHKYWSRLLQREAAPEAVPAFQAVDPFDPGAWDRMELTPPFWIKPVKAFLGQLGFLIHDLGDFQRAMRLTRERIRDFGEPFNRLMERIERPEEIARVDGNWCIAEEIIGGHQCTVEGYEWGGEIHTHGIVDSFPYAYMPVFFSLEYPSSLPEDVRERAADISRRVMRAHGYEHSAFNIEYYWRERTDEIKLLEINPRISQSHGPQFWMVDGAPNHKVVVDLALGRQPEMPHRRGLYGHAGKFMIRRFNDARVRRAPKAEEIAALRQRFPGAFIEVEVHEGERLSEIHHQDQYSFLLAELFLGGRDSAHCHDVFYRCADALHIELDYLEETVAP
ncbi:MAG: acetyl-CoA carboxylase biotin carboxylase subunit family protein [Alphaproteobacteria bacterium]